MSLITVDTSQPRQRGWHTEAIGYVTTPQWIMAIIFAGFAVVGLNTVRSRWITSSQEHWRICFRLVIFNRHMDIVTIRKEVKDGNQK